MDMRGRRLPWCKGGSVGLRGARVARVSGAGRGGRLTVYNRACSPVFLCPFTFLPPAWRSPRPSVLCVGMSPETAQVAGGRSRARGPACLSRPAQTWTGSSQARLGLTEPADGAWRGARGVWTAPHPREP